jgi:hypothetical protein
MENTMHDETKNDEALRLVAQFAGDMGLINVSRGIAAAGQLFAVALRDLRAAGLVELFEAREPYTGRNQVYFQGERLTDAARERARTLA